MTVIKFHKQNKKLLKEYSNGSFDNIVSELINEVEDYLPIIDIDYGVISTMELKKETIDKLKSYSLTEGESYENIIIRMLLLSKTLNTTTD